MDERLAMPKKLNQNSPRNPAKNLRVSQVDPVLLLKERESSGDRTDVNYFKRYIAPLPK